VSPPKSSPLDWAGPGYPGSQALSASYLFPLTTTVNDIDFLPQGSTPLPQKRSPDIDTKAIVHGVLADGTEHVVSYGGTASAAVTEWALQLADSQR